MSNDETKTENELPPGWIVTIMVAADGEEPALVKLKDAHGSEVWRGTLTMCRRIAWLAFGVPRAEFLDTLAKAARWDDLVRFRLNRKEMGDTPLERAIRERELAARQTAWSDTTIEGALMEETKEMKEQFDALNTKAARCEELERVIVEAVNMDDYPDEYTATVGALLLGALEKLGIDPEAQP